MILSTLQVAGRGLGNGDATVLSACAADSNGKLRLALCDITRHDRIEQVQAYYSAKAERAGEQIRPFRRG